MNAFTNATSAPDSNYPAEALEQMKLDKLVCQCNPATAACKGACGNKCVGCANEPTVTDRTNEGRAESGATDDPSACTGGEDCPCSGDAGGAKAGCRCDPVKGCQCGGACKMAKHGQVPIDRGYVVLCTKTNSKDKFLGERMKGEKVDEKYMRLDSDDSFVSVEADSGLIKFKFAT